MKFDIRESIIYTRLLLTACITFYLYAIDDTLYVVTQEPVFGMSNANKGYIYPLIVFLLTYFFFRTPKVKKLIERYNKSETFVYHKILVIGFILLAFISVGVAFTIIRN